MKVSLATADIPIKAYANVFDCLRSQRIGRGKYVELLEKKAADYFGVRYCLAVSSGTLADIVMLATLKEMFPGKNEVILPALTFVAQANAVLWAGLKPVFSDVTEEFQLDWKQIKPNENTLAIFPVHLIGKYSGWHTSNEWPIIEDCCEAMGGVQVNKFGTSGIAGAFSMYPSHTITTGEGGLIITNDQEFYRIAKSIHNHGKINSDFDFEFIGINAKMTNLQAAIGCALIDRIDEVNKIRRENVELYNELLGQKFYASAPHCYPIIYQNKLYRDLALKILERKGIEARKLMSCVPDIKPYFQRGLGPEHSEEFPNARKFANCGLFLPVHQNLTEDQIRYVCNALPKP